MAEEIKNTGASGEAPKNKPAKASKKPAKPNPLSRVYKWFRELKSEAKKVMWPSRKQVINNTLVVLATVLVVGSFVWIADFILQQGVALLIQSL